jgi:hypothetical protein
MLLDIHLIINASTITYKGLQISYNEIVDE